MLTVEIITQRDTWNDALRRLPYAHILQSWEWGDFKFVTTGWTPQRFAFRQGAEIRAMASVGIRRVGPLKVMVVSKGPALAYEDINLTIEVLAYLENFARKQGAIWMKIDPDVIEATGIPGAEDDSSNETGQQIIDLLKQRGWRYSNDQVQFRNTITLDLTQDEEALLAQMSQNTRRKVRTAEKKAVTLRDGSMEDLETLYRLYQITGERDQFLIRPFDYYRLAWQRFIEAGLAHPLIAEVDGTAVAHVILFHFGQKCWYFYGASSNESRERMPNYALQWAAIQWAKAQGYAVYDMWGAPDVFNETDRMWGVYEFKRGFRGSVVRHIGAWDYAPYPFLYRAYTQIWPRVLHWMKRHS